MPDSARSVTASRRHLAQLLREAAPIINEHADRLEFLLSTVRNLERRLRLVEAQIDRITTVVPAMTAIDVEKFRVYVTAREQEMLAALKEVAP